MVARFLEYVVVTHWLPHIPIQFFFRLVLVYKKIWCCLFTLSIQIGVFAMNFHIILMVYNNFMMWELFLNIHI